MSLKLVLDLPQWIASQRPCPASFILRGCFLHSIRLGWKARSGTGHGMSSVSFPFISIVWGINANLTPKIMALAKGCCTVRPLSTLRSVELALSKSLSALTAVFAVGLLLLVCSVFTRATFFVSGSSFIALFRVLAMALWENALFSRMASLRACSFSHCRFQSPHTPHCCQMLEPIRDRAILDFKDRREPVKTAFTVQRKINNWKTVWWNRITYLALHLFAAANRHTLNLLAFVACQRANLHTHSTTYRNKRLLYIKRVKKVYVMYDGCLWPRCSFPTSVCGTIWVVYAHACSPLASYSLLPAVQGYLGKVTTLLLNICLKRYLVSGFYTTRLIRYHSSTYSTNGLFGFKEPDDSLLLAPEFRYFDIPVRTPRPTVQLTARRSPTELSVRGHYERTWHRYVP